MGPLCSELVSYVVQGVREEEGTLGKTKLVKLLYLIDLEHYRRFGRILTGWDWTYYHYGPYASEIEPLLKSMPVDFEQEEVRTARGHRATVFRAGPPVTAHFERMIDQSTKRIVDKVIKAWALEDLYSILDYVYFDTEPKGTKAKSTTQMHSYSAFRLTSTTPSSICQKGPNCHASGRDSCGSIVCR